jgi:hypothetical protein
MPINVLIARCSQSKHPLAPHPSGRLLIGEGPRSVIPTLAFWRKCGRAEKEKRRLNVGKKRKKKS